MFYFLFYFIPNYFESNLNLNMSFSFELIIQIQTLMYKYIFISFFLFKYYLFCFSFLYSRIFFSKVPLWDFIMFLVTKCTQKK
jgi:hypothetical protein